MSEISDSRFERSTEPKGDELETLSWYHGDLSRHKAEALLMSNGQKGSYLLRNCYEAPSCLALSVRANDSVKHFQVTRKDKCYAFGFQEFSSLREFIHHFANQPLVGNETGCLIVMEFPYPREVEEPCVYEPVLVHTAMHTGMTAKDLVASAPSLGTKEGFLVKQGAFFKSWKTRWFTLNRNELKYFKNKSSAEPIRTLDLRACSAVQADFSRKRINCFCKITRMVPLPVKKKSEHGKAPTKTPMVFPERTFYLCAFTGIEAEEWIAILSWKLSHIEKSP